MISDRWHQVTEVFHAALARSDEDRRAFLDEACAGDVSLREEIDAMLAAHDAAAAFGSQPAVVALDETPSLESGVEVGPYRVKHLVGAGGMGVVYRAHDPRVGRDVAIKMILSRYGADPERLRRFEQEARTVGALNHPNLVTLFDVGTTQGRPYLVTEFVEGETLRARLTRGRLTTARACEVASAIACGLAAAHAHGIVHRDLKPENVILMKDGRVKILDFGLAKLRPVEVPSATAAGPTAPHTIVGTPAYMAPEQVRGDQVSGRTDVFALGTILFEMLTGTRAFDRASSVETLHAVLNDDPPELTSSAHLPPPLVAVLRRCLVKDPDARFESARDLAFALDLAGGISPAAPVTAAPNRSKAIRSGWVLLAFAAVAGLTALAAKLISDRASPSTPTFGRFELFVPPEISFSSFTLSPDGRLLVYSGLQEGQRRRLYLRHLDQFDAIPIPGTEQGISPFFSPDGEWVGFVAGGRLKRVRITGGGPPIEICAAPGMLSASGTWAQDQTIVFASIERGLQRVSAEGGSPQFITTVNTADGEVDHHNPQLLPGGQSVLFTSHAGAEIFKVVAQSLRTGERKVLVQSGFDARYLPSGHLLYASGQSLFAVAFDPETLTVTGSPIKVVDQVATITDSAVGNYGVSGTGTLLFVPEPSRQERRLVWVDRNGVETPMALPPRFYLAPRLSPDGERLALWVRENTGRDGVWVHHFKNETFVRLTVDGSHRWPLWNRSGQLTATVVGGNQQDGSQQDIVIGPADNTAPFQTIVSSTNNLVPGSWTPDDKELVYADSPPTDFARIAIVGSDGRRRAQTLIEKPRRTVESPALSPDGRWLAFMLDLPPQIFVQPFPGPGTARQLTTGGGQEPVWRSDGQELFYRGPTGRQYFALPFDAAAGVVAGKSTLLFDDNCVGVRNTGWNAAVAPTYDVTRDGQRFVCIKPTLEELLPRHFKVVLNWTDELTSRVPTRD